MVQVLALTLQPRVVCAVAQVFVRPEEHMGVVVERLFSQRCSMAPILSGDPNGEPLGFKALGPL